MTIAQTTQQGGILTLQRQYDILALNRSETAKRHVTLWQSQECTDTMRYARNAAQNCVKKDGHSRGKQQCKCNQRGKKR